MAEKTFSERLDELEKKVDNITAGASTEEVDDLKKEVENLETDVNEIRDVVKDLCDIFTNKIGQDANDLKKRLI